MNHPDPDTAASPERERPRHRRPTVAPLRDTAAGGWLCDVMLGKLARELRLLGMDVEYQRNLANMQAYRAARATGRTLLTRNKRLTKLPGVVFVESQNPPEQVAQVRAAVAEPADRQERPAPAALAPPRAKPEESPFGRCLECNCPLEKVSREQARPSVPFFVYQIHYDFRRCPRCKRVYWPGNHVQDMARRVPARSGTRRRRG
ncbi:hypothetical protein FJY69_01675 [candidate division WOR-3 bacterium]|nr:hypothetical protein [candidate division WOR-3 bacterium]